MIRWGESYSSSRPRSPGTRGQSVTEFALVLPVLMLVLLTVADFGRFFATGIAIESSARTAAELAAQEWVAEGPKDYDVIQSLAWRSVCDETGGLPNVTPSSGGSPCDRIPTMVCVHDAAVANGACGTVYNDSSLMSSSCPSFASGEMPDKSIIDAQGNYYVEVRVCYRFSTILQVSIPFISGSLSPLGGDFVIERTRTFTVPNY